MTRSPLPRLMGLLGTAGALALGAVAVTPQTAEAAACAAGTGVTVVVSDSRGHAVHCAEGDSMTAMEATQAVVDVTQVQKYPGVLCRLNGEPADQACVQMPPADAYWSFYYSEDGGDWVYSTIGAAEKKLSAGDAVAWAYTGSEPGDVPSPGDGGTAASEAVTDEEGDSGLGSKVGMALGGAAIIGLGAAAFVVARRRNDEGG